MGNLTNVEIGSVVLNMIESVPTTISGATLWNTVDNEVFNAENMTGDSISTTAIGEKYQPAIISLTAAAVLRMMELTGADVANIKLGDFSVSKGQGSNTSVAADRFEADGLRKLDKLGNKFSYYKSLG